MANKKIAEMSNEELLKNEKTIKAAMYGLGVMNVLLLLAGIFLTIKKGFNAIIVIPVTMIPIIIVNANSLKEIKKEKEMRGLK